MDTINISHLYGIGRWKLLCELVPKRYWREWTATESQLLSRVPSSSIIDMLEEVDGIFDDLVNGIGTSLEPKHRDPTSVEVATFVARLLLLDWPIAKFESQCFNIARCTLAFFGYRMKGDRKNAIETLRSIFNGRAKHKWTERNLALEILKQRFIELHLPPQCKKDTRFLEDVVEFQAEFETSERPFPVGALVGAIDPKS